MENTDNQPRLPRAKNATMYALTYQLSNKYLNKRRTYQIVAKAYINNDFQYNGTFTDIYTFSDLTKIPVHIIHKEMYRMVKDTQLLTKEDAESLAQGLVLRALNGALADGLFSRGLQGSLAPGLLRTLAKGQKPIGLLNSTAKHLEVSLQQQKLLLEIANILTKSQTISLTQNIHNQNTYNTQYLTIEKAMELLEDKTNSGQLLSEPSQKALAELYKLDSIEDIRAKNTDEGAVAVNLPTVNEELLKDATWAEELID